MDIQVAVKYSNWPQIYGKLYVALFGCNITMLVAGRWVSLSYSSWKVSFWPPTRKLDCFPPIISSCYVLCREGKSGYCQLTKKNLMRPWREILVGKPNLANKSTWAAKQTSVCMAYVVGRIDYLKLWALGGYEHTWTYIWNIYWIPLFALYGWVDTLLNGLLVILCYICAWYGNPCASKQQVTSRKFDKLLVSP